MQGLNRSRPLDRVQAAQSDGGVAGELSGDRSTR